VQYSRNAETSVRTLTSDPRIALLRELADPVRLRVIDRLGHTGPATVSEMAAGMGLPLPQLSNHLRRLREARLVRVRRSGRHAIYELADPGLEALLPLLDRITGRVAPPPEDVDPIPARTCYDHLAGRLGVALFATLSERGALDGRPDGTVELGPAAARDFGALGVDPEAARRERRRFAFECLDAVEHAPHLAGALGDAVADSLFSRGWIRRGEGRAVEVTPSGAAGLQDALGLAPAQWAQPAS
jgi:DNA-binding transcriptional ArsR family regulator